MFSLGTTSIDNLGEAALLCISSIAIEDSGTDQHEVATAKAVPGDVSGGNGGRWEGLRRMPVGWHRLYYSYWHENHTLYIDALVTYTE